MKLSTEELTCLGMMLDHAERWINEKWTGEWREHAIAREALEKLREEANKLDIRRE